MTEQIHLPCPFEDCESSDAFDYEDSKKVGFCRSCGNSYPHKNMRLKSWAKEAYPLKGFVQQNRYSSKADQEEEEVSMNYAVIENKDGQYLEHRGILPRAMEFYKCFSANI